MHDTFKVKERCVHGLGQRARNCVQELGLEEPWETMKF